MAADRSGRNSSPASGQRGAATSGEKYIEHYDNFHEEVGMLSDRFE